MESLPLLDEIVRDLEEHQESTRIKKLVFCACRKTWENEPNILEQFPLKKLISEFIKMNSNIDILSASLSKIIKSLNRQEVYAAVAQIIINKLSQIYNDSEDATQILLVDTFSKTQPSVSHDLVTAVVESLENHPEAVRIKKVIFSICKGYWENELNVIENNNLSILILELLQHKTTAEELKQSLYSLVESLNRKNLYSVICDFIIDELGILYKEKESEETKLVSTQIVSFTNLETHPNNVMLTNLQAKSSIDAKIPECQKKYQEQKFELRLKLIQYSNPLRIKMLLFYLINRQFDNNGFNSAIVKSYTLDDLLSKLFNSYTNILDIESKLYGIAKSITEPEENMQTASVIIESVRPFYSKT